MVDCVYHCVNQVNVHHVGVVLISFLCVHLTSRIRHFWATVCKTVCLMLSDRCLSVCLPCLSVTLVYCG